MDGQTMSTTVPKLKGRTDDNVNKCLEIKWTNR